MCMCYMYDVCSHTCTMYITLSGITYFMTCVINLRQDEACELVAMCHR